MVGTTSAAEYSLSTTTAAVTAAAPHDGKKFFATADCLLRAPHAHIEELEIGQCGFNKFSYERRAWFFSGCSHTNPARTPLLDVSVIFSLTSLFPGCGSTLRVSSLAPTFALFQLLS